MVYTVVHVCVMNNILMIIITLYSIEKSSITSLQYTLINPPFFITRHPNIGAQDILTQSIDINIYIKYISYVLVITQKYLKT